MFPALTRKWLLFSLCILLIGKLQADFDLSFPSIEGKAGYFFFADKKMRSIYDQGGLDLQLAASFPFWGWLQLYTSLEYLEKEGHSKNDNQKTKIWQLPFTVGLKACAQLTEQISGYLTLGPRYYYIHMENSSSFVDRHLHNSGIGGFLGTGVTLAPCACLTIDLFGEYSYERARLHSSRANVHTKKLQVGGFVFGIGLGYSL